jgi:GntR family transcriptional regulator
MTRTNGGAPNGGRRLPGRGAGRTRRNSERLRDGLEALIVHGQPGERLPSERELAATYGVARMTVRAALGRLARRGAIRRVQGDGTYIAEARFAQSPALTSFTEDMRARGIEPGAILIAQRREAADDRVAKYLGVSVSEPIVVVERVRTGNGEPVAVELAHLPSQRFPGLEEVDVVQRSLYDVLARDYGCVLRSCEQRVTAEPVGDEPAALLGVATGSPVLRIERVTRDVNGIAVEFVSSVYRGDTYELHTEHLRSEEGTAVARGVPRGERHAARPADDDTVSDLDTDPDPRIADA